MAVSPFRHVEQKVKALRRAEVQMPFRLFAALSIPDDVKIRLASAQQMLRESMPQSDISWTRPENFHLTLRFLGDVEAALHAGLRAIFTI